jgi:hypothetical protein
MLGLTLLQSTCNLPLQRDSSTIFRWRPCAPSARRPRIAPAAFAPAESSTAQKQKEAADSIPVTQCPEQPSNSRENDANPVLAYLGSAISGITQLWMHQGGKTNSSVALLEATAQRAAEVRKLPGHFSALGPASFARLRPWPGRPTVPRAAGRISSGQCCFSAAVHDDPMRLLCQYV